MSECCLCETLISVFLCLSVVWWWEWLLCVSLPPSLPLSVSTACHPWILWIYSAAILVTQLTTPYLRIAPAAGDNQLTGQICGCADAQTASPLLFYHMRLLRRPKQTGGCSPAVSKGKNQHDLISLDNIFCLHLLVITAHERLVSLLFDVSVFVRSISHYFGDSVYCDRWRQSKEDFECAAFKYHNFSLWVPDPLG